MERQGSGGKKVGVIAAVGAFVASACCVLPLLLGAVGIGSLGLAAALGRFHVPLLIVGGAAVLAGWVFYIREWRACKTQACSMRGRYLLLVLLLAASGVVAYFAQI